jgi:hypothetical protein
LAKVIYKYLVPIASGPCLMSLPMGARVLSVGFQDDVLFMWCAVDPMRTLEVRHVLVALTGIELPEDIADYGCVGRATLEQYEVHVFIRRAEDHG